MRDDIERYQRRADAAPRQIWDNDDIYAENNINPMRGYQGKANAAPRQIWGYDDIRTPNNPMGADMRRYQARADAGHPAMMASDDIKLGKTRGLYGRLSGSMIRTLRNAPGDGTHLGDHQMMPPPGTYDLGAFYEGKSGWWWAGVAAAVGVAGYVGYRLVK